MTVPALYRTRSVYHFLAIQNLPSVVTHGLLSKNEMQRSRLPYKSIAYDSIQSRRSSMRVTCGPRGVVHDYVPFYFCRRSPMLRAVLKNGWIQQHDIIYLKCPIIIIDRLSCVFTDASANTSIAPHFFDDPRHLDQIKWELVETLDWGSQYDKPGQVPIRRLKQAELLVHKKVDLACIEEIVVWNEEKKAEVRAVYAQAGLMPPAITYGYKDYYFLNYDGTSAVLPKEVNEEDGLLVGDPDAVDLVCPPDEFVDFWDEDRVRLPLGPVSSSHGPEGLYTGPHHATSSDDLDSLLRTYDAEIHGRTTIRNGHDRSAGGGAATASTVTTRQRPQPMLKSEQVYDLNIQSIRDAELKRCLEDTKSYIKGRLGSATRARYPVLAYLVRALRQDFGCLFETKALSYVQLTHANKSEHAVAHTQVVVSELVQLPGFHKLSPGDQVIVEVAAFLHEIGYGTTSGEASPYTRGGPSAAIRALIMLRRILTEEIADLKPRSARLIPKLICYYDLVEGVLNKQRTLDELVLAAASVETLDMLVLLGTADMKAWGTMWSNSHISAINDLRARAAARL